ncbi:diacylglycerol kinase family protein [Streptomyces sp. KMM 9044]|uniref:diacylglycerol kinase family protein n=1 Tax=Streptomyces sp. KMM 9044 TaxID=2744474 RepID=UPI002150D135|nr:diacylglycerol kinase family protein [Streptomyces sp. KMM 9044]WAX80898.1 diacylglycerol kinase family protein [Streptomyces sp. KMM 9044]
MRVARGRARRAVEESTGALVAVGGDGMANLALQVVVGTGTPLGLIAVGTGTPLGLIAVGTGTPLGLIAVGTGTPLGLIAVGTGTPLGLIAVGTGTPLGLIAVGTGTPLGLIAVGTGTPLGLIAVGTGNDFARSLAMPLKESAAAGRMIADALKCGRVRDIDLGRAGGRRFGTVLASGFDSRVNDRGNRMRLPAGRFTYDLAVVAALAALRPIPYRITLDDGDVREAEATLAAVGNGASYGGGMRICPGADLTDGLFDVTAVGDCGRAALRIFPTVYRGTHVGRPEVSVFRASRVEPTAEQVTGYADGEPLGPLPLTASCVRGAVRVVGPRGAASAPGSG